MCRVIAGNKRVCRATLFLSEFASEFASAHHMKPALAVKQTVGNQRVQVRMKIEIFLRHVHHITERIIVRSWRVPRATGGSPARANVKEVHRTRALPHWRTSRQWHDCRPRHQCHRPSTLAPATLPQPATTPVTSSRLLPTDLFRSTFPAPFTTHTWMLCWW
jgi:hypothetical protein